MAVAFKISVTYWGVSAATSEVDLWITLLPPPIIKEWVFTCTLKVGPFPFPACTYTVVHTARASPVMKVASSNLSELVPHLLSLTAQALVPGSSGRARASSCGRAGSIFLLISATVGAFALLSLVVLLVGHFTLFGRRYIRPLSTASVSAVWHFCGLHFCSGPWSCVSGRAFSFLLLLLVSSWTKKLAVGFTAGKRNKLL